MSIYEKGREAPVDYVIDWGAGWLGGAEIVASRWSVEPAGNLVAREQPAEDGRTRAMLSGGLPGWRYRVASEVRLSDGRIGRRAIDLAIGAGR